MPDSSSPGYWAAFAGCPRRLAEFDYAAVPRAEDRPHHLGGSSARWTKNSDPYMPFVQGLAVVLVMWLILCWMYRRRIFLRI